MHEQKAPDSVIPSNRIAIWLACLRAKWQWEPAALPVRIARLSLQRFPREMVSQHVV